MKILKRIVAVVLVFILTMAFSLTAFADRADFEYKLILTDQNGQTVTNPRSLHVGDTLNVEIELTRTDTKAASYETYGMEFRLLTRGLTYNGDGASFRNATGVKLIAYDSGDSVGFAYYDMEQKGERINNPVLAGKWSYTVTDPAIVNITVPVALLYIVNDSESYEPVGNAILYLDPNGGEIVGTDVSGEYRSGTIVTLPDAKFAEYSFLGWSDGVQLYQAGANFTVSGIVTLVAQWEGMTRDRQILFDTQGGEFEGEDPSGMYADGEVVVMPEAAREGYKLVGWDDNGTLYAPGDEYTVDGSKVFKAVWEEVVVPTRPTEDIDDERTPLESWFTDPDGTPNVPHIVETAFGLPLLALGIWWLIILWKRRWVKYSLKNGDVSLDFKDREHSVKVEVMLLDGRKHYTLTQSGLVEKKHKLRFIKATRPVIEELEEGRYEGRLILTNDEGYTEKKKCRIKVLDRELRERENQ